MVSTGSGRSGEPADKTKRRRRDRAADEAVQDVSRGLQWDRLPGSRTEVAGIKDLYTRAFEVATEDLVELRDQQATETAFRELAPQSTLLHLATHGYFASPDKKSALAVEIADADRSLRSNLFGDQLPVVRGLQSGPAVGPGLCGSQRAASRADRRGRYRRA